MASACKDFSEFSNEELCILGLNFDNIPFEENIVNDKNAEPRNEQPLIESTISAKETTQLADAELKPS